MPSANGRASEQPERVGLCLRVSSEEQRDRETIEIQRDFLNEYCRLYRLEIAGVYDDDGVSGTIPLHERPEGRRLLEDARAGKFTTLLVYKLDRLGRSLLVIVDAHDRLQAAGVTLRSATEPIDTSTAPGRLIFQMLASFAEYERETIGERTRAGLHRAHRKGRHMGPVPLGYRADKEGGLQIEPEEAEIVREIIMNIAAGSTLYAEAARLNDLGIRPPSWKYAASKAPAKQWSAPTIRLIARQTAYGGVHTVKLSTGEVVEQRVPRIVAPELQGRALARLEENRRYSGGRPHRRYLLTGLITCEVCGCSCVGRTNTARGKKYPYYKCSDDCAQRGSRAPRGHAPNVPARWLEETVWADVRRFVENPGEVLERVRAQGIGTDVEELEARRTDLSKRLAAKHKERERYIRFCARGSITEEELDGYLADLRIQTEHLRLLLESVESDLAAREHDRLAAESTASWLLALRERVEEIEGDTEEAFSKRRELAKLLVAGITAGRKEDGRPHVRITYRFGPPEPSDKEDAFVDGVEDLPPQLALKHSSNFSGVISRMPPIWNAPAL